MFNSFFKKFVLAFLLVVLVTGTSHADLNFTLVNRSGFSIAKLFLSPSGVDNWNWNQYEVPGKFPVIFGDKIDINLNDSEIMGYKFWDLRVGFENGKLWEFHKVDIAAISALTINVDGRALDNLGNYHDFPKSRLRPANRFRSRTGYRYNRYYRSAPHRRARYVRYGRRYNAKPYYRSTPRYRRYRRCR